MSQSDYGPEGFGPDPSSADFLAYMPPMREQWDPNCDAEMELAGEVMGGQHLLRNQPAHSTTLWRTSCGTTETVIISAYPGVRLIVFTLPRVQLAPGGEYVGSVREVPVGFRDMATAETFRACFERHVASMERQGWKGLKR